MNYSKLFRVFVMIVAGMIAGMILYRLGKDRNFTTTSIYSISKSYTDPSGHLIMAQLRQDTQYTAPIVSFPSSSNKNVQIATQSDTDKIQTHPETAQPKTLNTTPSSTTATVTTTETSITTSAVTTTGTTFVAVVNDGFLVPPIVHYTWYSTSKLLFRFHHFISILSAYKHIKPKKIMFWYELKPQGPWWEEINRRVPVIEMVFRKAPTEIFGKPIKVSEHQSDIVRLEAVMKYGGIYTDLDVIVLKSFDPLRNYPTTMGYEREGGLCNGIIISAPNAPFLNFWHETYKTFDDKHWNFHSVILPAQLARKYPNLIHTEDRTLHRPNWVERGWLYDTGKIWDWSQNYAIHLWFRFHNVDHNPDDIKTIDTTMGQLFRYIYYDKKDLIPKYSGRTEN